MYAMMNDETKLWGMRILHGDHGSSSQSSNTYDARAFWIVNTIFIIVTTAMLVWCICRGAERLSITISSGNSSDQVYRERLRQRRLRQEQEKLEPPEQRRAKLLESFHRNKVHSVVQDDDFVRESMAENKENACVGEAHDDALNAMEMGTQVVSESAVHNLETSTAKEEHQDSVNTVEKFAIEFSVTTHGNRTAHDEHDQAMNDVETCEHDANDSMALNTTPVAVRSAENEAAEEDEHNVTVIMDPVELHVETGEPGYIRLRTSSGKRTVPNCCAVCLCAYEPGESIVWSFTKACPHAFHEECVVEWLIKKQDGTPCPCCRQEFTDLALYNESVK